MFTKDAFEWFLREGPRRAFDTRTSPSTTKTTRWHQELSAASNATRCHYIEVEVEHQGTAHSDIHARPICGRNGNRDLRPIFPPAIARALYHSTTKNERATTPYLSAGHHQLPSLAFTKSEPQGLIVGSLEPTEETGVRHLPRRTPSPVEFYEAALPRPKRGMSCRTGRCRRNCPPPRIFVALFDGARHGSLPDANASLPPPPMERHPLE